MERQTARRAGGWLADRAIGLLTDSGDIGENTRPRTPISSRQATPRGTEDPGVEWKMRRRSKNAHQQHEQTGPSTPRMGSPHGNLGSGVVAADGHGVSQTIVTFPTAAPAIRSKRREARESMPKLTIAHDVTRLIKPTCPSSARLAPIPDVWQLEETESAAKKPWTFGEVDPKLDEFEDIDLMALKPLLSTPNIEIAERPACWAKRSIKWPNDALRMELIDMHCSLKEILRERLTWQAVDNWQSWFCVFEGVLREILKLEEFSLYPRVGAKLLSNGPLAASKRSHEKLKISNLLSAVTTRTEQLGRGASLVDSIKLLLGEVGTLTQTLLNYFSTKESTLPELVLGRFAEADWNRETRAFVRKLLVAGYGIEGICILSRALTREERKILRKELLPATGPFNGSQYPGWIAAFEKSHNRATRQSQPGHSSPKMLDRLRRGLPLRSGG